jgi:threonine/homoserine/homoserine lactone efflux protein
MNAPLWEIFLAGLVTGVVTTAIPFIMLLVSAIRRWQEQEKMRRWWERRANRWLRNRF